MSSKRTSSVAALGSISPAKKRIAVPKSPKTVIQDASAALVDAIKNAEEDIAHKQAQAAKQREIELRPETQEAERKAASIPYVYLVQEMQFMNNEMLDIEIEGVFTTLEEANKCVRNHCYYHAERDDPDADFDEGMSADGGIWYDYKDDKGNGSEVKVLKKEVKGLGSEKVNNWGRDIGVPCPPKTDSEAEDSYDSEDSCRRYDWIPREDRFYNK